MTYNIMGEWGKKLTILVAVIQEISPDYLVLNEAHAFIPGPHKDLKRLAKKTGLFYTAVSPSGEGKFHVALLSKKPIKFIQFIAPLKRAGILAVVDSEFGELALVGTHLNPSTEVSRLEEIQIIINALKPYKNKIILGDLNSLSPKDDYSYLSPANLNNIQKKKFMQSERIRFDVIQKLIENKLIDAAQTKGENNISTTPTPINTDLAHTTLRLDYVFLSSSLEKYITDYFVIKNENTKILSDHFPICVKLQMKKDNLGNARKRILDKNWISFAWNVEKIWNLNIPSEKIPIDNLLWHLEIPLWDTGGKQNNLTPNFVLQHPEKYPKSYKRILASDLAYPIDILWWKNKWIILDGIHRLAKSVILKKKKIQVRKIPQSAIPEIKAD